MSDTLVKRLEDGSIAFGACFMASNAAVAQAGIDHNSVPSQYPIMTQVVIPILTGVIMPFLKEIILDAHKRRKERRTNKKAIHDAQ